MSDKASPLALKTRSMSTKKTSEITAPTLERQREENDGPQNQANRW